MKHLLLLLLLCGFSLTQDDPPVASQNACQATGIKCASGEECRATDDGPKCVETKVESCDTKVCAEGEKCEQAMVKCAVNTTCVRPPPICVPQANANTNATSCEEMNCPEGTTCRQAMINCIMAPCDQPAPECVPQDLSINALIGCENVRLMCEDGEECGMVDGKPQCVSSNVTSYDPCIATTCLNGTVCKKVEAMNCLSPPCDRIGECVPINTTEPMSCPKNETFKPCGGCEGDCANPIKPCLMMCGPGKCECDVGYVRNNGSCIKQSDCPVVNGTSSYDPCIATTCPKGSMCKKLEVQCFAPPCAPVAECVSMNTTEPMSCPKNETFKACGGCEGDCVNSIKPCVKMCGPARCECDVGYVRNNGSCIKQTDCPAMNGTISIDPCISTTCPEGTFCKKVEVNCFVPPCTPVAECVSQNSSEPISCPKNETWQECGSCETDCMNPMRACFAMCGPAKCECNPGYVRHNGSCIKQTDCPANGNITDPCISMTCPVGTKCEKIDVDCFAEPCYPIGQCVSSTNVSEPTSCPKNETWDACGGCESNCQNTNKICMKICMPGKCTCKPGFVRNNGSCIEQSDCPANQTIIESHVCPKNETWNNCGACDSTCETPGMMCMLMCQPPGACACNPGFVRNNGSCIFEKDCPAKLATCETIMMKCEAGQRCGIVFGKPTCVPEEKKECGINEELKSCGTACEPSCLKPGPQICTEQCLIDVCQCKSGYVRDNTNNKCVLEEQCMEKYVGCDKMNCPNGTSCERPMMRGKRQSTELQRAVMPARCTANVSLCDTVKCSDNKMCQVMESNCTSPPCAYTAQCVEKVIESQCALIDCMPDHICVETDCKDGMCDAMCVPFEQARPLCEGFDCPDNQHCQVVMDEPTCVDVNATCSSNEEYLECTSSCEATCGDDDPMAGISFCTMDCGPPGCQCKSGFARELTNGTCVKREDCPPNFPISHPGCAAMMCMVGFKCEEEECENPPCAASCVPMGDSQPENSTTTCENVRLRCDVGQECGMINGQPECVDIPCGLNEEYSECKKCEEECGKSALCNAWCAAGCQCIKGFVRNTTYHCVEEEKCVFEPEATPPPILLPVTEVPKCGSKEVYEPCGGCEPSCDNIDKICPAICNPGKCVCAPGFARLGDDCVAFKKCPNMENNNSTCEPNEMETDCMPQCETSCRGIDICNDEISADACVAGCVCRPNYKRNAFGKCTHSRKCYKKAGCKKNEKWHNCMPCEQKCGLAANENCAQSCFSGCACKDGYSRDKNDACVPTSKC